MAFFSRLDGLDGVEPAFADFIEQADAIVGASAPELALSVSSGFRSPAYQAQLRARWDRGDRAGLVVRPALSSKHTQGRAVDLQFKYLGELVPVAETPMEYWRFLDDLLRPVGVRWGGRFRNPDPNHFEL